MFHAQVPGDTGSAFTVRYSVERRSLRPMLDPACVRTLETPALFRRELSAEQFADVNDSRSVEIPARRVLGQAFESPPPGEEACDLCGYHCWAEFFAPGLGWLPADASCACK